MMSVCAHCGADITLDKPILINDFFMVGAGYPLFYRDVRVPLTHDQAIICWALMKAYPGPVTLMALMERMGSESDDPELIIRVHICRIRRILREHGLPPAIKTLDRGNHAYTWDPCA